MKVDKTTYRSPNFSSRKGDLIDTLVVHHTGGVHPAGVAWMCSDISNVSAHYYIRKTGEIYLLVDEEHKAWHAGKSCFDFDDDGVIEPNEKYLNARSIGIELESEGDFYSDIQINSLDELTIDILQRNEKIQIQNVLGHKEVSDGRKWDPGNFDMKEFRDRIFETMFNKVMGEDKQE